MPMDDSLGMKLSSLNYCQCDRYTEMKKKEHASKFTVHCHLASCMIQNFDGRLTRELLTMCVCWHLHYSLEGCSHSENGEMSCRAQRDKRSSSKWGKTPYLAYFPFPFFVIIQIAHQLNALFRHRESASRGLCFTSHARCSSILAEN